MSSTSNATSNASDARASEFVTEVRQAIDARLEELLADAEQRASRAGEEPHAMLAALAGLVRRGGKRLRPALVAAAARACGRPLDAAVVDVGCALELLQGYFLVHDDWMDGDTMRRGGPAVHVALAARHRDEHLGAALAVLAGDLACAMAHHVMAAVDAPRAAMLVFTRMHEDVVLGQALDLTLSAHDAAGVERMHALKTGAYTTVGPIELGAILAGATEAQRAALVAFAAPLGVAFQLRDDLLGAFGSEAETGKPVGSDLRARKHTALIADALARASAHERRDLEALLSSSSPTAAQIDRTLAILDGSGARAAIEARVSALLAEAHRALDAASIDDAGRALLRGLARALAERSS